MLAENHLFFSKIGDVSRQVVDSIQLANVVSVETRDPEDDDNQAASSLSLEDAAERSASDGTLLFIQTHDMTYIHTVASDAAHEWLVDIRACVKAAKAFQVKETLQLLQKEQGELAYWQARTKIMYESTAAQYIVSLVIVTGAVGFPLIHFVSFASDLALARAGFFMDVSEAQLLPEEGTWAELLYLYFDVGVTSFFALELGVNLVSHANDMLAFWLSFSNCFDCFIVVVSVSALSVVASGINWPPVKMLRLIRVCRILRIFRKLKNLNRIIEAVSCAVFPVCNSFFILLVCTLIYATLGTQVFRER